MILKIAGGCGEHGRNCFLVKNDNDSFLVDCGLLSSSGTPELTEDEIRSVRYLFLTHSHADHSGAIPWLYQNGFNGKIIASEQTLKQLAFAVSDSVSLEGITENRKGRIGNIEMQYGRSGHCVGSVWYQFSLQGKKLMFSGDYTENTQVYSFDPIRDKFADIAVVDCAYGNKSISYADECEMLIKTIKKLLDIYGRIVMPVPKYGRGLELLCLLKKAIPKVNFCGDGHFIEQSEKMSEQSYWFKSNANVCSVHTVDQEIYPKILFVSDPQIRSEKARKTVLNILQKGGTAVMTGTVEEGTMAEKLINDRKMHLVRYPVHQNYIQYKALVSKNHFSKVIAYHSAEFHYSKEQEV